jgi:sphingomyelin phosphodiesterase
MSKILILIFTLISLSKAFDDYAESLENELDVFIDNYIKENKVTLQSVYITQEPTKVSCSLCENTLDIIQSLILIKYGQDGLYKFLAKLCGIVLEEKICYAAIQRYGPIALDSLIKRATDKTILCSSLNLCPSSFNYISIEDYAKRVLSDKPKNIDSLKPKINMNGKTLNVLQVTDIHLDLNYKENATVDCGLPLCCHDKPKNIFDSNVKLSGKYGAIGKCDCSLEVVDAFSTKAKELEPDFILFTGDNIAHNVWEDTQEEVVYYTRTIIDSMERSFGKDTPIYPAIGNHEKAPVDEYYGPESVLLNGLAEIFKPYLSDEAYETFKKYGYYSMLHKNTNLRIISLNCLVCDTMNFNLIFDASQAKDMYDWFENELKKAEKNNEVVYLLDHIPLVNHQHTLQCTYRLKILLDRYQHIIRGYFSGHSHSEYLTIVKEYNSDKPTHVNYICSGLTTYSDYQPSFRLYEVDDDTKYVKDYIQYRMDLEESNKKREPVWFISYKANEFFKVDTISNVKAVNQYEIGEDYIIKKYTDSEVGYEKAKKKSSINEAFCDFKENTFMEAFKCQNLGTSKLSKLLDWFLNSLMGSWRQPKN